MRTFKSSPHPAKVQRPAAVGLPTWKRTLDLAFCFAALPFFAIATFFVAVLMSVASPGPIFFRQERVGYMGRRFRLYKFRSMHVGADTASHQTHFVNLMTSNAPMQKLDAKGDRRLIPLGRLIRALGIDELPQMLNVLRGDMSVVGPRPCIPYEYDNYTSIQRTRFQSTPGLTGLWQVSGKNRTTFDRMIQLDIEYATRKSLYLDLKIVLLTFPAILVQLFDLYTIRQRSTRDAAISQLPLDQSKDFGITKTPPEVRAS